MEIKGKDDKLYCQGKQGLYIWESITGDWTGTVTEQNVGRLVDEKLRVEKEL